VSAIVYGCLWILFNLIGRLLFRYRAQGQRHIPKRGGVVVAANHASYLDIPLLGCGIRRRVWFLGRHNLFPNALVNRVFQWLGWIPMRQDLLDRGGFSKAARLLKEGHVVVLFPEGSRTPDGSLRAGKPGIGVLVAATGCAVVPAYIEGTYQALPIRARWIRLHPVRVTFGPAIDFTHEAAQYSGKELYRRVSRTVMARIAELGHVAPPSERAAGAEAVETPSAAGPRRAE